MITLLAAAALTPTMLTERIENGAWLAAIQIPGARTFSVQAFARGGSAFESEASHGLTHLWEHLIFADGAADAIAENAGFMLNATTYREFIRLHAEGPPEAWRAGITAVARLTQKPPLSAAEGEWAMIRQEAALAALDPIESLARTLWSRLPSPWSLHPMGGATKPEGDIAELHSRLIVGGNIVIVVAGDLDPSEGLKALRAAFEKLPAGEAQNPPPFSAIQPDAETESGRHAAASGIAGYNNPSEYVAAEIAAEALSSPTRLFADRLSAVVHITPSSSGSLAAIVFASEDGTPGLGVRASRLLSAPISDAEFAAAKARIHARYAGNRAANRALVAGLSLLFTGRTTDFAATAERVTKQQVDTAAEGFRR